MTIAPVATPWHLLTLDVTVKPPTVSGTSLGGQVVVNTSGNLTVQANVQPASSRDAIQYQRETGEITYDVFLAPVTTAGVALGVSPANWKQAQITYTDNESVTRTLLVQGPARDLIVNNCILHVIATEVL